MSKIRDRKNEYYKVQLNVTYRGHDGDEEETTVWAPTHEDGVDELRTLGLCMPAQGVYDAFIIPYHRITRIRLVGTADPKAVKAAREAQDAYDCVHNPRC